MQKNIKNLRYCFVIIMLTTVVLHNKDEAFRSGEPHRYVYYSLLCYLCKENYGDLVGQ